MSGLLLKDLLIMKNYLKFYTFLFIAYLAIGITSGNLYFIMGISMTMLLYYVISSFSFDEYSKWDSFANALPLERKQIVLEKYIFAGIMIAISIVFSVLVAWIYSFFQKTSRMEVLFFVLTTGVVGVVYLGIQIPLVYKTGVEKTRLFLLFFFVIVLSLIMGLPKITGVQAATQEQVLFWLAAFFIAALLWTIASYFISCRIYEKKEF